MSPVRESVPTREAPHTDQTCSGEEDGSLPGREGRTPTKEGRLRRFPIAPAPLPWQGIVQVKPVQRERKCLPAPSLRLGQRESRALRVQSQQAVCYWISTRCGVWKTIGGNLYPTSMASAVQSFWQIAHTHDGSGHGLAPHQCGWQARERSQKLPLPAAAPWPRSA